MIEASSRIPKHTLLLIVVAALGYFVDIYDLILFNVVKKESLIALGFSNPAEIKQISVSLFNWQMGGMLVGGILWGILGDKKGRLKVLFGSILLYSVANVLNAFVTDIPSYAAIRFIAGIGLAGELGAGITLVSEVMSKENRGYGTMIIVTFGALGAVLAAFIGGEGVVIRDLISSLTGLHIMNWQVAYIVGGFLGLLLLLLRIGTLESGMYKKMHAESMGRGQFLKLFSNRETAIKYMHCIVMGLPVWFAAGVLFAMAEDFAQPSVLNIQGKVVNGLAVMYAYLGLSVGDLLSGLLSQFLRSRKKVVLFYLFLSTCMLFVYLLGAAGHSATFFYFICFLVGVCAGYWALFVSIAAEQFGTNIRSTVASTVPNFVRGSVIPISASIHFFEKPFGVIGSAIVVGMICIALATYSMMQLKDTFGKDLDYTETF
jgi:predicted MFS family arabinose efflux permease